MVLDNHLSSQDKLLLAKIQHGLPLVAHPYAEIAATMQVSEQWVIERLTCLQEKGFIRRFGVVVHHRELGYRANGMVVWDIPDMQVDPVAEKIALIECVTLCYRRPRRLPEWRYNLFSMIHGKNQQAVRQNLQNMIDTLHLDHYPHQILFSTRRFKQCGGNFIPIEKSQQAVKVAAQ